MATYKVVGLPNSTDSGKVNKTVKPIKRKDATIEAEKGETIWTNYNRNVDNLFELKNIGGKKHTEGGTPMAPPSAEKEGESSSFIFSNNKKMIIKDPEILKYFGESGSQGKTPAEVSKKWLDALATAKAVLKDDNQDKISKQTAKLTMDNASFNLSSLALWQESKKNFKDGMTDIFNAWFDKTKVSPEELLTVDPEHAQQAMGVLKQAALGGDPQHIGFDYDESDAPFMSLGGLKKYSGGGPLPEWKGSDDDLKKYFNGNKELAAQFQYIESLKDNPAFKKALFAEYKKAWKNETVHGKGYNNAIKAGKWKELDSEDAVVNNFIEMQKRNIALKAHGIDYTKIGQSASDGTNRSSYTNQFIKDKKLDDLALPGMDKTAQEQAAYIAFHELTRKQGTYNDNKELEGVLSPFSAPKLGIADENVFGKKNYPLSKADGIYTDTTTGQIAAFNPPTPVEAKEKKDDPYKKGTTAPLITSPYDNPDGFRIQDENTMNRAFKAKRNILNIPEWQKATQTNFIEPQFVSPERKIAEANTAAAQAIKSASTFGSQASTQAAIQAINAQVYSQAANAIDADSDKNVGLFNATNQSNTQLANAKHQQDANEATNLWAQHATRVQAFANAHGLADDKITEAINNAYTERANRWNLNTNSTYEKIDPRTGKIYQANAKPLDGDISSDQAEAAAAEFEKFKKRLPGVDDKVILSMMKGIRSGDYSLKDDGITDPGELKAKG